MVNYFSPFGYSEHQCHLLKVSTHMSPFYRLGYAFRRYLLRSLRENTFEQFLHSFPQHRGWQRTGWYPDTSYRNTYMLEEDEHIYPAVFVVVYPQHEVSHLESLCCHSSYNRLKAQHLAPSRAMRGWKGSAPLC